MAIAMKMFFLLIIFGVEILMSANNYTVEGYVFNQQTGEVVPGASVQLEGRKFGTYTTASGKFRIPLPNGKHNLKISSMGYESQTVAVSPIDKELKLFLVPKDLQFKNVQVTGDINAENIIKRAIKKKNENVEKLKTFTGELYSKFVIEVSGNALGLSSGGSSLELSAGTSSGDNEDKVQMYIMETFSDNFIDYENSESRSIIRKRRQTSNIEPENNLFVLSRFQNFYNDYFRLAETRIMNPLNDDAFAYYNFELLERTVYAGKYIYKLKVIPSTKTFPAFEGTISILEDSYNLIELDLTTSEYTSIPFVESLKIYQKFDEINIGVWHPVYLNLTGKASVDVIKGISGIETDITATSIYNNYDVNKEMPDSIFALPKAVTVSEGADVYDIDYWEKNSLRDISERELKVYEEIGSSQDSISQEEISCNDADYYTSVGPYLDFNRVTSILPGIVHESRFFGDYYVNSFAGYSFGQKEFTGKTRLTYSISGQNELTAGIYAGVFSDYNTLTLDNSINQYYSLIFAALYHDDYYDYYKSNGLEAGINLKYKQLRINTNFKIDNQFSLKKTTDRSIFSKEEWRGNPEIIEGRYFTPSIDISFGRINDFYPGSNFDYEIKLNATYGNNITNDFNFHSTEATADILIPTFNTGYSPMMLRINGRAGYASEETPIQHQFRMPVRLSIISGFGSMTTAPLALFGGTEYYAIHLNYNITDIWWRALRLPRYNGRGIDLLLSASLADYNSKSVYSYVPTEGVYSEIGFGLSRIPLFFSDLSYLKTEFRWGVGRVAKNKFGWSVSLALPM
jgi:hypothetical protein